ncbi:MAG: hypothetical protein L6Q98_09535 [Anaerolineae bacterium]|nr:hypothetical protein [Anaerolineae bacterium]
MHQASKQVKEKGVFWKLLTAKPESPLFMTTISEFSETLYHLLTTTADELAKKQDSSSGSAK